jgi:hypothetical protein
VGWVVAFRAIQLPRDIGHRVGPVFAFLLQNSANPKVASIGSDGERLLGIW